MKLGVLFHRHGLYFAWVVALAGFCLSVYFGEVLLNEPCPLCWYQRIALFPLALLLGIAAYRNDRGIIPYVLPLALLGATAALYQIFEGYFPVLQKTGICRFGELCAESPASLFGVLDFPVISSAGFILITGLLLPLLRQKDSP